MECTTRHSWCINPERRGHRDSGDSVAAKYGDVVSMVECRNLT
jgi:hypothetical protein